MKNSECSNCGKEVIGAYCHHCGQKKDVLKLTWRAFFNDLQKRLFGFDNTFLRTVKDLTIAPQKVIRATLEGVRVRYIGPVGYYFLLITIFVLLLSFMNVDMAEYSRDITETFSDGGTEEQIEAQRSANELIYRNFRLFAFLMLPFFVLSTWLVFMNKKLNFLETAVLVLYAQGHPMLLTIFAIIGYQVFGLVHAQIYITPVSYLYFVVVCAVFYPGNKLWNFIKGVFALLLGLLILFFLIFGITVLLSLLGVDVLGIMR